MARTPRPADNSNPRQGRGTRTQQCVRGPERHFHEANPSLPLGILSLVTGYGETDAALCRTGVGKIAFTGSTRTGSKIMATCAESLTPVVVECGGKDPVIVAADADIAAAAEAVAWGAFINAGEGETPPVSPGSPPASPPATSRGR
ncbi:aldehyde dehydrogenase family protein [Rhodococcus sp. H29-C3]|uniref:aldehyde dehydrogenase family protein n=1 Tax=Rhodococcus sp. H29-C3 TaxID=3046307 RepID=UPI0032D593BC